MKNHSWFNELLTFFSIRFFQAFILTFFDGVTKQAQVANSATPVPPSLPQNQINDVDVLSVKL